MGNNRNNQNIKINILTRTSNRPLGFVQNYTSIKEQTYKLIKHIVAFDTIADLSYLKGLGIHSVDVSEIKEQQPEKDVDTEGNLYAPYNLYCNTMLDMVEDGWILFLDDDDNLYHNKVIEDIVAVIQKNYDEDIMYIWQMRYPDGSVLPTNKQINNQVIKKNFIGSPCYLFHSKYKNEAHWDAYKASDFRFLQQLLKKVPKKVFLPKVMVQINNYGDLGQRNDLVISTGFEKKMPNMFYKNALWSLIPKYHTRIFGKLLFHKKTYKNLLRKFSKSKAL